MKVVNRRRKAPSPKKTSIKLPVIVGSFITALEIGKGIWDIFKSRK